MVIMFCSITMCYPKEVKHFLDLFLVIKIDAKIRRSELTFYVTLSWVGSIFVICCYMGGGVKK